MNLTEEIKNLIINEYKAFEALCTRQKKAQRDELAQFFTPPEISIKLLEAYGVEDLSGKIIRDPTSGSGNLLAAALIAGADSDKVFGNEYDATMVKLCKERLNKVCDMLGKLHIRDWQIHQGNALIPDCLTEFGPEYDDTILKELLKKRWGFKGGWMDNPERYKEQEQVDLFGGYFND